MHRWNHLTTVAKPCTRHAREYSKEHAPNEAKCTTHKFQRDSVVCDRDEADGGEGAMQVRGEAPHVRRVGRQTLHVQLRDEGRAQRHRRCVQIICPRVFVSDS